MGRDRAWNILASIALAEIIRKDRDAVGYACMDDVKVHKNVIGTNTVVCLVSTFTQYKMLHTCT